MGQFCSPFRYHRCCPVEWASSWHFSTSAAWTATPFPLGAPSSALVTSASPGGAGPQLLLIDGVPPCITGQGLSADVGSPLRGFPPWAQRRPVAVKGGQQFPSYPRLRLSLEGALVRRLAPPGGFPKSKPQGAQRSRLTRRPGPRAPLSIPARLCWLSASLPGCTKQTEAALPSREGAPCPH